MKKIVSLAFFLAVFSLTASSAEEKKIYWGSDLPPAWNGQWPEKFQTAAEKSSFTKTSQQNNCLDFISMLKWNSENVYVYNMFISDQRRSCPVVVMANPRITSPRQARDSNKTIIYLQGGIHPEESEGKEALLMLMRDILLGEKKYLLDKLIIMCAPNFNVDGGETLTISEEQPTIAGVRQNAVNLDINRDAIKLETLAMQGACRSLFNNWYPTIILDTHRMSDARHGYAIVYAASNVPTAHPAPRGYVTDKIFPAVRQASKDKGGIEIFFHGGQDSNWPPTEFTHDRAIWTVEGKFMASYYGLRNRMSILVETPGYESYEKKIYSQYVFARELLEYTSNHGEEMRKICTQADSEVVEKIRTEAETGKLKNFVQGKYESYGKVDLLAYRSLNNTYIPGTSIRQLTLPTPNEAPVLCPGVELVCKPVGIKEASVPRGYLIPVDLDFLVEKLRLHNIRVNVLDKPVIVSGEEFVIDRLYSVRSSGYDMMRLDGDFFQSARKTFPAGTFQVDMAQPTANLAFYCLEPQVGDGFLGWGLLNKYLTSLGIDSHSVVFPIYKYFKIIE